MKTKIFYLLMLCLMVLGRGEVWAQTTVGYTEEIDGSTLTLKARALSNGGLSHLSISDPSYGSNITSHAGTSKTVYNNGTTYTNTDSWRKNIQDSYDNQYVGYTLTVEAGYCLNISSVTAKILVAENTYYWKVEIENSTGTTVYTSSEKTTTTTSSAALDDNVSSNPSLSGLTGTVTVKLYVKQGGTNKYFSINYLQLGVSVVEDPSARLSGLDQTIKSYPYTWDFTQISNCESEFIYFNDWAGRSGSKPDAEKVYVRQTSDGSSDYYNDSDYPIGYNISALKGLRFSKGGYIAPDCNIDYIYVQGQPSITIPSVPEGSFVVLRGLRRDESGTITGINTQPSSRSSQNGPFVFKANSTNNVTLGFGDGAYNLYGIDVIADDLERFSSLPYEWRFSDASWWVTKRDWLISTYWGNNLNLDAGNIRNAWGINTSSYQSLYLCENVQIPETNGLMFKGESGRVGLNVGHYLWLNEAASVQLPLLPTGTKIIVRARAHSEASTLTPTNTTVLDAQAVSATVVDYEFVVNDGSTPVTFTNGTKSIRILDIKVEKSNLDFVYRAITEGVQTTMPYSSTPTVFTIEGTLTPNVVGSPGFTSEYFEVTSSDNDIITTADNYYINASSSSNHKVSFINLKTGTKAGTAVVTFRFKGNQYYNPSSFDVVFVVSKADPLFNYQHKNVEVAYGGSVSNTLNKSSNLTVSKISYTSNDTHVAEVSSSGEVNIKNAGTAVIRATFAGDDNYEAAETAYTLNVTGTASSETLSWVSTENGSFPTTPADGVSFKLGDSDLTYPATCSPSSTVNYKSSDSDIVTVDGSGKIHAAHPGTATVWAYTDGNGNQRGAELSYTVTVNGGNLSLGFDPTAGTVNVGCIIMPRLMLPSLEKGDIELLSMESSDPTIASVPTSTPAPSMGTTNLLENDYLKMAATRIDNVYPPIKGESVGKTKITVYFRSPYYNNGDVSSTTYTVTVTDKLDNFNWANNSRHSYTLVEGEFMMMPAISGNANGNITGLSNGKVNKSTEGGYVYSITGASRTIKLNDKDWKYGQGVPNFTLTPTSVGGGKAYIFWIVGGDESHPALAIYAEQAGDLILRATDSQTGWHCDDITLHVVSKDQRQKQVEQDFWADKKFPFTWDFSNVSSNSIVDDEVHWKTNKFDDFDNPVGGHAAATGEHILGMASSFGYDYADEQDPDKKTSITQSTNRAKSIWKYISNGEGENCRIMPEFEGLRIGIGTNSFGRYIHKKDRASLHDANSSEPRFQFIGGDHYLYLPEMPAVKTPGSYKLIMKLGGGTYSYKDGNIIDKGNSSHVTVELIGDDGVELSPRQYIGEAETVIGNEENHIEIVSFDISSANAGKALRLALNNASVYWIAFSTEERIATKKANITSYAAATYCYNEDLDLAKSVEANSGTKVYRASNFNSETSTVTLTAITNRVPALTGLVLKSDETSSNYMIATGRNTDSYSTPQKLVSVAEGDKLINLLKPAPVGTEVKRFVNSSGVGTDDMSSEDIAFTNFVLTSSYKKVDENGNDISGYQNSDWMYYRVNATTTSTNNMSYLQLPNKLREIGVDGARKAVDGTQDYKLSNLINIVFEDELQSEVSGINVKQITPSLNVNDAWYTLQGVRVDKPAKGGVYIQRGRKVILK